MDGEAGLVLESHRGMTEGIARHRGGFEGSNRIVHFRFCLDTVVKKIISVSLPICFSGVQMSECVLLKGSFCREFLDHFLTCRTDEHFERPLT